MEVDLWSSLLEEFWHWRQKQYPRAAKEGMVSGVWHHLFAERVAVHSCWPNCIFLMLKEFACQVKELLS